MKRDEDTGGTLIHSLLCSIFGFYLLGKQSLHEVWNYEFMLHPSQCNFKAMGWRTEESVLSSWQVQEILFPLQHPASGAPPISYSVPVFTGVRLPGSETDNTTPASAKVKNAWTD